MTWRCLLCGAHGKGEDLRDAAAKAIWHELDEHG